MQAGPSKRVKVSREPAVATSVSDAEKADENSEAGENEEEDFSGDDESEGTEDETSYSQKTVKSKKTQKRKRRATSPSQFGSTLQTLLSTNAPSNQPLSLQPSIGRQRANDALEVKAKKLLEGERKQKEERNHVTDVIGGWGGESERAFRKVAQRGGKCCFLWCLKLHLLIGKSSVVKLFNAIQQTQAAGATAQEQAKANRGSGKPTLPAPVMASKAKRGDRINKTSSDPSPSECLFPRSLLCSDSDVLFLQQWVKMRSCR